jgi:FixJ family two-component response regulator
VDDEVLLQAIHKALACHGAVVRQRTEVGAIRELLDTLTPREMDVLRRVLTGALNKQIATRLGIAEKTVKVHRGRVMEKLAVRSVAELVRVCAAAGVSPGD